jgi:hypothetical protein
MPAIRVQVRVMSKNDFDVYPAAQGRTHVTQPWPGAEVPRRRRAGGGVAIMIPGVSPVGSEGLIVHF